MLLFEWFLIVFSISHPQQSHKTHVVWEIAWIRIVIASVGPPASPLHDFSTNFLFRQLSESEEGRN